MSDDEPADICLLNLSHELEAIQRRAGSWAADLKARAPRTPFGKEAMPGQYDSLKQWFMGEFRALSRFRGFDRYLRFCEQRALDAHDPTTPRELFDFIDSRRARRCPPGIFLVDAMVILESEPAPTELPAPPGKVSIASGDETPRSTEPPPAGKALAVSGANITGRLPSAEALREITLLARRFLEAARRCHDGDVARFRQGGEGGSRPDRSLCAAHNDFYKRLDESDAICPYGWPDVVRVTLERFRDYGGGLRGWGEIAFVNRETGEYEPARAETTLGEIDRAIGDLEGATDAPPAGKALAAPGNEVPAAVVADPYDALVGNLRKRRADTRAAFLEFMKTRSEATFDDIAHQVHGDSKTSEDAIRKNVERVNRDLEGAALCPRFRTGLSHVFKEVPPE